MEGAREFVKVYEKFKSDFMKKHLSNADANIDSESESEYDYVSKDEEDECSVDSVPVESLFQRDSSDEDEMFVSKRYFESSSNAASAKPVSAKMIKEIEMKRELEEKKKSEDEFEQSLPIQTFKYWKPFIEISPKKSKDSFDIAYFYTCLYEKWLPKLNLLKNDVVYHYLEKAGSKTNCHLIPNQMMEMILIQSQLPYEWQVLLREMFPKTFNPYTHQMNGELYYQYVDKMIQKYDEEDESEESFVKKICFT